jgi:hypothetical protein
MLITDRAISWLRWSAPQVHCALSGVKFQAMAGIRAQVRDSNLEEGKWFYCSGWWLFPCSSHSIVALRQAIQELSRLKEPADHRPTDSRTADEIQREIVQGFRELREHKTVFYNAQPEWSARQVSIHSSSEVLDVVNEFLRFVEFAAAEFCWTMNRPHEEMHWKKHSWKHTTFAEVERIIADVKARRWLPPQLTLDVIGTFEQAQELFRSAERIEPEAITRIDSLFPSEEDKYTAARHLFGLNEGDAVPLIPTAVELGYELLRNIFRSDSQKNQDHARDLLKRLISKQAATGSQPGGGRPPSAHHPETVITIWMMCYAMAKQIREVDRFVSKYESNRPNRHSRLHQYYPQLYQHKIALSDVLDRETVRSAFEVAGKFLELSTSKIDKVVYPRRPHA